MRGVFAEFEISLRRERKMEVSPQPRRAASTPARVGGLQSIRLRRSGFAMWSVSGPPPSRNGLRSGGPASTAYLTTRWSRMPRRELEVSRGELEAMAARLEVTGEYRAVRELQPRPPLPSRPDGSRLGLVVDVETTGADLKGDEGIEPAKRASLSAQCDFSSTTSTARCTTVWPRWSF